MAEEKIAVIGVGLIGGSLGLALRKFAGKHVIGMDQDRETLKLALKRGAVSEVRESIAEAVKGAEIVFVATPVSSIASVVKEVCSHVRPGTIITDVGSTKARIVRSVEEFLPSSIYFIGGHPMAGSEMTGITSATPNLFKNCHYLLTPTKRTDTAVFKKIHSLLTSLGAKVLSLSPDRHDQIVAVISHLPHVVSTALVNMAVRQMEPDQNLLPLAAGGFRDTTRIAASNPQVWLDICLDNNKAILAALRSFKSELERIIVMLEEKDENNLRKELEKGRRARIDLPTLLKKDIAEMRELLIPVFDRPGVISDITLTIGELGVNVEDIEMLHVTKSAATLRLTVSGEKNAHRAAEALRQKGYGVEVKSIA